MDYKNSPYALPHLLVPSPIMGIRGDAWMLKLPVVG
jgi:hypothetical protein